MQTNTARKLPVKSGVAKAMECLRYFSKLYV